MALCYIRADVEPLMRNDKMNKQIEVALSRSTFSDMADIEEEKGKGPTPKEAVLLRDVSWA